MQTYLQVIAATAAPGNATEHSYLAHVEALFHELFPKFSIPNEARRQACGAPDFVVAAPGGMPLGYTETDA